MGFGHGWCSIGRPILKSFFSKAQRSELVRDSILHLPEKYRTALILRDINEMSTEESGGCARVVRSGVKRQDPARALDAARTARASLHVFA